MKADGSQITIPVVIQTEILNPQKGLIAKRKLNPILRSKAITPPSITVGGVLQVYSRKMQRGIPDMPRKP